MIDECPHSHIDSLRSGETSPIAPATEAGRLPHPRLLQSFPTARPSISKYMWDLNSIFPSWEG